MDDIDQKIKEVLQRLREAHKESEKYYASQVLPSKPIVPHDIYPMALAKELPDLWPDQDDGRTGGEVGRSRGKTGKNIY